MQCSHFPRSDCRSTTVTKFHPYIWDSIVFLAGSKIISLFAPETTSRWQIQYFHQNFPCIFQLHIQPVAPSRLSGHPRHIASGPLKSSQDPGSRYQESGSGSNFLQQAAQSPRRCKELPMKPSKRATTFTVLCGREVCGTGFCVFHCMLHGLHELQDPHFGCKLTNYPHPYHLRCSHSILILSKVTVLSCRYQVNCANRYL